jgi:hypothetical protein
LRGLPRLRSLLAALPLACCVIGLNAGPASAGGTGGAQAPTVPTTPEAPSVPLDPGGGIAALSPDGRTALAPPGAPTSVAQAIDAANRISGRPYRYGGGHRSFRDSAYDCSGSVSYALHAGGFLSSPLDSSALMRWGVRGRGAWITVYTSPAHAFAVIAGLRFDTAGPGPSGPRWRGAARSSRGFLARHPFGL